MKKFTKLAISSLLMVAMVGAVPTATVIAAEENKVADTNTTTRYMTSDDLEKMKTLKDGLASGAELSADKLAGFTDVLPKLETTVNVKDFADMAAPLWIQDKNQKVYELFIDGSLKTDGSKAAYKTHADAVAAQAKEDGYIVAKPADADVVEYKDDDKNVMNKTPGSTPFLIERTEVTSPDMKLHFYFTYKEVKPYEITKDVDGKPVTFIVKPWMDKDAIDLSAEMSKKNDGGDNFMLAKDQGGQGRTAGNYGWIAVRKEDKPEVKPYDPSEKDEPVAEVVKVETPAPSKPVRDLVPNTAASMADYQG